MSLGRKVLFVLQQQQDQNQSYRSITAEMKVRRKQCSVVPDFVESILFVEWRGTRGFDAYASTSCTSVAWENKDDC